MTAAKLEAAVLAAQSYAATKLDAALVELSFAQVSQNANRIGNAAFDLRTALDALNALVDPILDRAGDLTMPAFMATIPDASPFVVEAGL